MEEEAEASADAVQSDKDDKLPEDEGIDMGTMPSYESVAADGDPFLENQMVIRTLDGEIAGDELEGDAINYKILLGKIEGLLGRLKLDA